MVDFLHKSCSVSSCSSYTFSIHLDQSLFCNLLVHVCNIDFKNWGWFVKSSLTNMSRIKKHFKDWKIKGQDILIQTIVCQVVILNKSWRASQQFLRRCNLLDSVLGILQVIFTKIGLRKKSDLDMKKNDWFLVSSNFRGIKQIFKEIH